MHVIICTNHDFLIFLEVNEDRNLRGRRIVASTLKDNISITYKIIPMLTNTGNV